MAKKQDTETPKTPAEVAIEAYGKSLKSGKTAFGGKATEKAAAKIRGMENTLSVFSKRLNRSSSLEVIPFGINTVDEASGIGGVAKGKMLELFGQESGGKSYLTLKLIASCQAMGYLPCLIDAEQSFDPYWAEKHGVDPDNLLFDDHSKSAEGFLEEMARLCGQGLIDLLVLDSTASLTPQAELDGVIGDQTVALQARVLGPAGRKIMNACSSSDGGGKVAVVWINQLRDKPGVMFGASETTPGGRALKFYCHQRLDIRHGAMIKKEMGEDKIVVGQTSYGTFVKNKLSRPWGKCKFDIIFDEVLSNPIVLMCEFAHKQKMFRKVNDVYRFYCGEDKIDSDANEYGGLANWIYKNGHVSILTTMVSDAIEENGLDTPDWMDEIDAETLPPPMPKVIEKVESEQEENVS